MKIIILTFSIRDTMDFIHVDSIFLILHKESEVRISWSLHYLAFTCIDEGLEHLWSHGLLAVDLSHFLDISSEVSSSNSDLVYFTNSKFRTRVRTPPCYHLCEELNTGRFLFLKTRDSAFGVVPFSLLRLCDSWMKSHAEGAPSLHWKHVFLASPLIQDFLVRFEPRGFTACCSNDFN